MFGKGTYAAASSPAFGAETHGTEIVIILSSTSLRVVATEAPSLNVLWRCCSADMAFQVEQIGCLGLITDMREMSIWVILFRNARRSVRSSIAFRKCRGVYIYKFGVSKSGSLWYMRLPAARLHDLWMPSCDAVCRTTVS